MKKAATVLFALVFAAFGIFHLVNANMIVQEVPQYMPAPQAWPYITGILLILAAISFILGIWVRLAGYLLALYLLIVILVIHIPALGGGNPQPLINLFKDAGLIAGAILIAEAAPRISPED